MGLLRGLSGRLLVLTILVVMLVEVVIFVPSVSRFRVAYLEERVMRANIATMVVLASPDGMVTEDLSRELLQNAEVINIALQRGESRALMLSEPVVPPVAATYDLRTVSTLDLILQALSRLAKGPARAEIIRVIAETASTPSRVIEITMDARPLAEALRDYGWRILKLSLIISLFTAAVVFVLIRRLVVGPLLAVIDNVREFQANPDDARNVIRPSGQSGEVAEAERAIAEMEADVIRALKERARLAQLGEALAKISHDLRNMLAAQQLMVDRLERSDDPMVNRVMPKIIASLNRAIHLCQRTLDFGRAEETEPEFRDVALHALVQEVTETVGISEESYPVRARIDIEPGRTVPADPEQLYRVLANLIRNASEAISATGRTGEVSISAWCEASEEVILVADTGPGLPMSAREHLFKPFKGGARRGGTGLGLSIAHELVAAHGGRLELLRSTTEGTAFAIRLPARHQSARSPAEAAPAAG
ncbi:MAG: sensor histidine kinase [Paracoccaceae bacterium]